MAKPTNSAGNTDRDLRKWLREQGVKPTKSNVELIGREVRRTEAQNARIDEIGREQAKARGESGLYDRQGRDAVAKRRAEMKRRMERDG